MAHSSQELPGFVVPYLDDAIDQTCRHVRLVCVKGHILDGGRLGFQQQRRHWLGGRQVTLLLEGIDRRHVVALHLFTSSSMESNPRIYARSKNMNGAALPLGSNLLHAARSLFLTWVFGLMMLVQSCQIRPQPFHIVFGRNRFARNSHSCGF
jgi:hypothetical protein